MQYFFADAPMKKKIQKFCVRGGTVLFGHQVQNYHFALINKIFLQTLVAYIIGPLNPRYLNLKNKFPKLEINF